MKPKMTNEVEYLTRRRGSKLIGIHKPWVQSFEMFYNDMSAKPNAPVGVNHYTWAYLLMFDDVLKKNKCSAAEWRVAMKIVQDNIHAFRIAHPELKDCSHQDAGKGSTKCMTTGSSH